VAHSTKFQAQLLAEVSREAERQYRRSDDYRPALPWCRLDDLDQQAWSKACAALDISPEEWCSALDICRTPGQSVKLLLGEMRILHL